MRDSDKGGDGGGRDGSVGIVSDGFDGAAGSTISNIVEYGVDFCASTMASPVCEVIQVNTMLMSVTRAIHVACNEKKHARNTKSINSGRGIHRALPYKRENTHQTVIVDFDPARTAHQNFLFGPVIGR